MPQEPTRETIDFDRLSLYLKSLANPNRLELLWVLRNPAAASDIHLTPKRKDEGLSPARAISRQSVMEHLDSLEEVGVVERVADEEGKGQLRVVSQARLFAVIEELRALTAIRPSVRVDVDATLASPDGPRPEWPRGPKLVLASGPWEGRAFALQGAGPWGIGRSRAQEVSLSYDPYVSSEHARVFAHDGRLALEELSGARNACRVNFVALSKGERRALRPGDVVGVGRSLLVYQSE